MDAVVVPVLHVEGDARADGWYGRLGFVKEWEHQSEPATLLRFRGTRDVRLYLSEHTSDAGPDPLIDLHVKDIDAVSDEFGIPFDEEGSASECDLVDPDGNRLRVATRRS